MKALVLRVDYGGGAPYPDQHAAVAALYRFVLAAALPKPIVIDTGDGLEVYWPLGEELPVGRWRRSARALAAACRRHGLAACHRVTVDARSLWRTPGTHNKALSPPFLVRVIDWGDGRDPRMNLEAAPIRHPWR
jgi:hypothetical protein